jgi:predicted lipoprotein
VFITETATFLSSLIEVPMRKTSGIGRQIVFLVALILMIFIVDACTIVEDEEEDAQKKDKKLDIYFVTDDFKPDEFVEKIWGDKVVPYFKEKCFPISDVLPIWVKDQEAAGQQFGYREKAEGSPWNFRVKGSGRILSVNTASRASTVDVDLDPADGSADVLIQIGPVIKDSAIRDSLEFISFTDFTNQLEFARLSNAFNKMVNKTVTGELDRDNLMGKSISFNGAFTQLQDSDLIRITPVSLEVK